MPRIKASPKKCVKSNSQSNTWVFLVKGEALEIPEGWAGSTTPDVVQLRHPQTGAPALFLFSPSDSIVQEVLTFSENQRSWLIEDGSKSDGKLQLSTPVDPLFLVLPYLRKSSHASPLDQIIRDDEFPETERLLSSAGLKHITQIADKKSEELNAYMYNEEKTLNWMQKKTGRVAEVLKEKGIHCGGGSAISSTFVKSSKSTESPEAYLKYAHGVISEYVADDLSAKLSKRLGLLAGTGANLSGGGGDAHAQNKRKQLLSPNGENKRAKTVPLPPTPVSDDADEPMRNSVLDLSKPVPAKSQSSGISSKEKARAKAAAGSKNISSFFKKK